MLHRNVMIDGTLYTDHELVMVTYSIRDGETILTIASYSQTASRIERSTALELVDTLTLQEWEEVAWNLEAYQEWKDESSAALDEVLAILTDEQAEQVPQVFPEWEVNKAYAVGNRVRYKDILYRCVQAHTSQDDWTPDLTPSLWVRTSTEDIPEWVQPTGAHDAYNTGDRVKHNGKIWICDIDANAYEPGVYGWEEIV